MKLAALALLIVTAPAIADWPSFGGGPSRNMVNRNDHVNAGPFDLRPAKDGGSLLWKADLGTRAYAGPVISSGRIFVGTNNERPRNPRDTRRDAAGGLRPRDKGVLMCFRAGDGSFLWQHVNDKMDDPVAHDWPREGVCSTPWVEGERLWYVTNRGEVVCLDVQGFSNGNQGDTNEQYRDKSDADIIWSFDLVAQLGVQVHRASSSSPLIIGDLLFVLTGNGVDTDKTGVPNPRAPSFVALNKSTGKVVWSDNSPGEQIMHGQWSSPSFGVVAGKPQVVFAGGDGWVRAFEPATGKPLWRFDMNRKVDQFAIDAANRLNHVIAMPVVHEGRVYIGAGQNPESGPGNGGLWCIDPIGKSGDVSSESFDESGWIPRVRRNPNSAARWHVDGKRFGRTISTAAVHDGLVYATDLAGRLFCFDASTGAEQWQHDLKSAVWGSALWVDGKVIVGNEEGRLVVFRSARTKKVLPTTAFDGVIHTSAVVANGVLYVMTERHLYAIQAVRP